MVRPSLISLNVLDTDAPAESAGGCGSCEVNGGNGAKCGNGLEKIYATTAVRFGFMKHVGEFTHPRDAKFTCGAKVVIQTNRGIEMGEQVSLSCNGCDRHVSREQIKEYVKNSGADTYELESGRILREAKPDDLAENMRLYEIATQMKRFAHQRAKALNIHMKIVECEYLLGGERAIFYFMADGRVDFRDLVKELSQEYQTRIKMHQVGARDEARLLADYETCGREVCCKVFLKTLKPISMRMAKLQRATLDPSKVSGRCGRLKCCLRYEHESYESLDAGLPRRGEKLKTAHGYGIVIGRQILTQLVQISPQIEGPPITVVIEDVLERNLKEFPPMPVAKVEPAGKPRREPEPAGPRERGRGPGRPVAERPPRTADKPQSEGKPQSGQAPDAKAEPGNEAVKPAQGDSPRPRKRRRGRRRRGPRGGGSGDGGGDSGAGGGQPNRS